jgi:hypothetical protein
LQCLNKEISDEESDLRTAAATILQRNIAADRLTYVLRRPAPRICASRRALNKRHVLSAQSIHAMSGLSQDSPTVGVEPTKSSEPEVGGTDEDAVRRFWAIDRPISKDERDLLAAAAVILRKRIRGTG